MPPTFLIGNCCIVAYRQFLPICTVFGNQDFQGWNFNRTGFVTITTERQLHHGSPLEVQITNRTRPIRFVRRHGFPVSACPFIKLRVWCCPTWKLPTQGIPFRLDIGGNKSGIGIIGQIYSEWRELVGSCWLVLLHKSLLEIGISIK